MPTIENKENIFALGQNVLVEMIEEKEQNEAGVFVPDMSKDRETFAMGKVLSTGLRKIVKKEEKVGDITETEYELPDELKLLETFNLKKGDVVLLKKFDYTKIKVQNDDKDYRIYATGSIIAKISEA